MNQVDQSLELIAQATSLGTTHEPLDEQLRRVCELTARTLGVDACAVRQYADGGSFIRVSYGMIETDHPLSDDCVAVISSITLLRRAASVQTDHHPVIRSYSGAPMVAGDHVLGLFGVYSYQRPRELAPDELMQLQIVANHIAVVLQNETLVNRLEASNATLDQHVADRTRELETAKERLEEFVYTVAHDLRAPLRSIVATSELLQQKHSGYTDAERTELCERQKRQALRLSQMIDDLLQWSRITRAVPQKRVVDFGEMCEQIAAEYDVDLRIASPIQVWGDRGLLRLVARSLIDNSVKFRKQALPVSITVDRDEATGAITIHDNGIGFEMAYSDRIFRPFERLVTEAQYPGTGIGLATVRHIVESHGGRAWAKSEVGVGTTVFIKL